MMILLASVGLVSILLSLHRLQYIALEIDITLPTTTTTITQTAPHLALGVSLEINHTSPSPRNLPIHVTPDKSLPISTTIPPHHPVSDLIVNETASADITGTLAGYSSNSLSQQQQQFHLHPKDKSPACYPSFGGKTNITRIFFSHTRKSGGTTLRRFLEEVATAMGWELVVREAIRPELPNRQDTLYVVNLRDPVERIISNYKFEGRWECRQMLQNESFVPSYANEQTLEQYLSTTRQDCRPEFQMWSCVEECYTKWYGKDYGCDSDVAKNYQFAHDRLRSYDIIVTPDNLNDETYVKQMGMMFGNLGNDVLRRKARIFCSEVSRIANAAFPLMKINATTLQQLEQWNVHDTEIYKNLTSCGPTGVVFPEKKEGSSMDQYLKGSIE
jgi:hypothetical protein